MKKLFVSIFVVALLSMLLVASLYAVTPDNKLATTWSSIRQSNSVSAAPSAATLGPVIVSPTKLDFGRVPVNTKKVMYLTIRNLGTISVSLPYTGVPSVPYGGFSTRVSSPFPAPASSTQNYVVVFNPQSRRSYTGTISISVPPTRFSPITKVLVSLVGVGY
jgi:hypothetical protein